MLWLATNPLHWLRDDLQGLAWQATHPYWAPLLACCARYTPHLYTLTQAPAYWLLDLRSVQRLWRGHTDTLAAQLLGDCMAWAATHDVQNALHIGLGSSPWQAAARVQCVLHQTPSAPSGVYQTPAVDTLPLWTLPAVRPGLKALDAMGVRTWGALASIPRAGVMRRWGRGVIAQLDQAYALAETPCIAIPLSETFDARHDLPTEVMQVSELAGCAEALVQGMAAWLRVRHLEAEAIEWTWYSVRRQHAEHPASAATVVQVLRASEAHADARTWWRLSATHWDKQRLRQPVVALRLRVVSAQAQRLQTPSLFQALSTTGEATQERLGACLDRLQARLGAQAVRQPAEVDAIAPEHQQCWLPHTHQALPIAACAEPVKASHSTDVCEAAFSAAVDPRQAVYVHHIERVEAMHRLRPPWLLESPQRLATKSERPVYGGDLSLLLGPERLEVLDWSKPTNAQSMALMRDYYVARSPKWGFVWIYKVPQTAHWYLHGLYE